MHGVTGGIGTPVFNPIMHYLYSLNKKTLIPIWGKEVVGEGGGVVPPIFWGDSIVV